jgi:hypothetical protein
MIDLASSNFKLGNNFTGIKYNVKGSEFGIVPNSRSEFLGCYSHLLLVESWVGWSPLGKVETDLWTLSQINTFCFSFFSFCTSSVTTVHSGPWLLIQTSIPSGVWQLCANFLFTVSSDPLQTITKYMAITLYCCDWKLQCLIYGKLLLKNKIAQKSGE